MPRLPEDEIERLKAGVDLVALMKSRGVVLKRRGAQYVACCPLHEEKSASFTVTPAKGLWHCFGCNEGGDAIRFVELIDKVSFREAAARLQGMNGSLAPAAAAPQASAAPALTPAARVKLLTRVAAFYHRRFLDTPEGLRYLTRSRGIHDVGLFKTFQVGYADGSLLEALPQDEQARDQLQALGVLTSRGRELFDGCVVFPLWNEAGAVVSLYGRRVIDGEVNHLYLPGARQGLWNGQAAKRGQTILLAESVIDALSAIDAGVADTIPCYGVHGLTDEHLALFERHDVKRIVIGFDADPAGREGAERVGERLREKGFAVCALDLPEGCDLNAYLGGPDGEPHRARLAERIAQAFAPAAPDANGEAACGPVDSSLTAAAVAPGGLPADGFEPTALGFKLAFCGRHYEVKGIAREATQLKATVKAWGDKTKGFELTTLDLYSARSRDAYARSCAALFGEQDATLKGDLNRLLERVETWRPEGAAKGQLAPAPTTEERAAAQAFLTHPELFAEILADLETLGVAGEETNKLLCYLAAVSRKLEDPLSLLIQSRSAAGKSTLQNAVLQLVPDEDKAHYTRLTSQALFYQEETSLAHKVLALEEAEGLGEAAYSLRALQSSKKITVATTIKDPATGKLKTDSYTVQGPVAVLLTTTQATIDPETASRFLTLTIDESREMTQTILQAQRHRDTLAGYMAELDRKAVIAKHQVAQRLLEPLVVINPYAEQLCFPVHSLRARRDHKKYLMLIKAVAYLHQKQRPVREATRGNQTFRYIEATREDVRLANALAAQVLGASLDELSAPARNLLRLIHDMVKSHCEAQCVAPSQYVFTRRDVRQATGWSDWQVRTHAKELEELEYLKARMGAWGKEYVYELAWDGREEERFGFTLTDPDTLQDPQ
jgi:DNA primase catalytic core